MKATKYIIGIIILFCISILSSCSLEKRVTVTTRGYDEKGNIKRHFNNVIPIDVYDSYYMNTNRDTIIDYKIK